MEGDTGADNAGTQSVQIPADTFLLSLPLSQSICTSPVLSCIRACAGGPPSPVQDDHCGGLEISPPAMLNQYRKLRAQHPCIIGTGPLWFVPHNSKLSSVEALRSWFCLWIVAVLTCSDLWSLWLCPWIIPTYFDSGLPV